MSKKIPMMPVILCNMFVPPVILIVFIMNALLR
jgi:hypothetical protein